MTKIKYAVLTVVAAVLFGCAASGYKVSDKGEKYKSALTREQGYKDLQKYAFKSEAQGGVCGAHTNTQFQSATPTAVQAPHITFDSFVQVITGASATPGPLAGTVNVKTNIQFAEASFKMDVEKLDKIRVQSEVTALCPPQGRTPLTGYVVTIDNKGVADSGKGEANALMINVSKDNLDYLVALLSYLSPNARILEGAGL
jgi:hypothetical protein